MTPPGARRPEPDPSHAVRRARLAAALRAEARKGRPWWTGMLPALRPVVLAAGGAALLAGIVASLMALHSGRPWRVVETTARPLPSLTPGAVAPLSAAELCGGARPPQGVDETTRRQVLRGYGMEHVPADAYELDALITPELGGTSELANLWPQPYDSPIWNARVKDEIEDHLATLVCRGELALGVAQRELAGDWIGAYRKYLRVDRPVHAYAWRQPADEPVRDIIARGFQRPASGPPR